VGVSAVSCTLNKGTSSYTYDWVTTQCSALYITSKAGGLIYSLDNQQAPAEVQLSCKYSPSFVLEEGDKSVMGSSGNMSE